MLLFLHGLHEAAPVDARQALTLHGPLRLGNSYQAARTFIVAAPQLPSVNSLWRDHVRDVLAILSEVCRRFGGDEQRTFLTGFSRGADGVFDIARADPTPWTALWAVDPTRVPERSPKRPIWLSLGETSRNKKDGFIERLGVERAVQTIKSDFVYEDRALGHVDTATAAYQDAKVYEWLLGRGC